MTSRISGSSHEPVLVAQVLDALAPRAHGRYVDGTVGAGGHASAILERSDPGGRLLGLDVDPRALEIAAAALERYGDRAILVQANFARCDDVANDHGFAPVDGILLDLGLSSMQLADPDRGFSFRAAGPLDMRADPSLAVTAADLVNTRSEGELEHIFSALGEEREARRLARAIVRRRAKRPFVAADEFGRFVAGVKTLRPRNIDPATKVFQALRIAVNDELGNLERGLAGALRILQPGGRLAVISFHSLEDRAVKTFFARESRDCICPPHLPTCVCGHRAGLRVVQKRPLTAGASETARNPRARSARLRVAERVLAAG